MNYKQIARQSIEDFKKGNINGIIDVLDDNVEWINPDAPDVPFALSVKGKNNVPNFFAKMAEDIDVTNFVMDNYLAEGNTVISWGHYSANAKSTGKSFTTPLILIWEFNSNGKCTKWQALTNTSAQAKAFINLN